MRDLGLRPREVVPRGSSEALGLLEGGGKPSCIRIGLGRLCSLRFDASGELVDVGLGGCKGAAASFGDGSSVREIVLKLDCSPGARFAVAQSRVELVECNLQTSEQHLTFARDSSEVWSDGEDFVARVGNERSVGIGGGFASRVLLVSVIEGDAHSQVEL